MKIKEAQLSEGGSRGQGSYFRARAIFENKNWNKIQSLKQKIVNIRVFLVENI